LDTTGATVGVGVGAGRDGGRRLGTLGCFFDRDGLLPAGEAGGCGGGRFGFWPLLVGCGTLSCVSSRPLSVGVASSAVAADAAGVGGAGCESIREYSNQATSLDASTSEAKVTLQGQNPRRTGSCPGS
jgi:hypothetical protein